MADRAHELAIACGDKEAELKAALALAQVLVWSVSTDRGRSLLEAQLHYWRDRNERMSSSALWYLAMIELRAGRWPLAAEYAEQVRRVGEQYDLITPLQFFPGAWVAAHQGDLEQATRAREVRP